MMEKLRTYRWVPGGFQNFPSLMAHTVYCQCFSEWTFYSKPGIQFLISRLFIFRYSGLDLVFKSGFKPDNSISVLTYFPAIADC